jgi:arylsulfatase
MMAIYAAMIDQVDANVGKLVTALKERNQLDNTLILFLTDNGGNAEAGIAGKYQGENPGDAHSNVYIGKCWAHLNNTPFRRYKHYNHEGGIASPLIAHWPAGQKQTTDWVATPAHVIDLMATCVELGQGSYPSDRNGEPVIPMEGKSLVPLLTGENTLPSRPLFWEHEGNAAIRVGNDKLVRMGVSGKWELYDMVTDRTEQNDLAAAHPEKVEELRKQFEAWAKRAHVIPRPEKLRRKKKQ